MQARTKVNHQITAPELRVLSETGEQIGVMKVGEALALATENGLDLVEIAPQARPPVAKIIDYSKFRYQQQKAEQQQRKKAKKTELKTVRLSVRISGHDKSIKAKQVTEFLEEGNLVRVEVRMRGRELAHPELAEAQLRSFASSLTSPHRVEVPIKRMGNTYAFTLASQAK